MKVSYSYLHNMTWRHMRTRGKRKRTTLSLP